jgi:hypothetical protein
LAARGVWGSGPDQGCVVLSGGLGELDVEAEGLELTDVGESCGRGQS